MKACKKGVVWEVMEANEVNCGVVAWIRRNSLRWFGHIERMESEEFVKKVYVSGGVGPNSRRGRPPGRRRDRVKKYMCKKGATRGGRLDQARRECLDRKRWRLFCRGHTLGGGGTFPGGAKRQSYRDRIDRHNFGVL